MVKRLRLLELRVEPDLLKKIQQMGHYYYCNISKNYNRFAALGRVHVYSKLYAFMKDLVLYSFLSTVATLRGHMELQYNNKTPLLWSAYDPSRLYFA